MTKRFCDICEQPANDRVDDEQPRTFQHAGKRNLTVVAKVSFRIQASNTEPDLCSACAAKLAEGIADQLRNICKGSTT